MNKILTILNIIDDELNLPDSKLRLTRLKTSVLCAIRSSFPDCKIYEFGSRVSGLATNESDYDLFLDLSKSANPLYLRCSLFPCPLSVIS